MQTIEERGWQRGIEPYSTHQQALAWAAVQAGPGDVLEIGAGWWSTPWLHGFCEASERFMLSVERDTSWLLGIAPLYANPWHGFVSEISYETLSDMNLALTLVDGGDPDRATYVRAVRNNCRYVVCHDTEPESMIHYPDMAEALADWPNRRDFIRPSSISFQEWPSTTVVWQ